MICEGQQACVVAFSQGSGLLRGVSGSGVRSVTFSV